MLKHAVRVNGVFIPERVIEFTLCHFAQPLVVWNYDDTYLVGLIGSGTAIHYRDKYFLVVYSTPVGGAGWPTL